MSDMKVYLNRRKAVYLEGKDPFILKGSKQINYLNHIILGCAHLAYQEVQGLDSLVEARLL